MITYSLWRDRYIRPYKEALYVAYNDTLLTLPGDQVTVSEAIGYGLLISCLAHNRSDFDKLLAFYNMFPNQSGLMCWQLIRDRTGKVIVDHDSLGSRSATDGDMDAAFALMLAGRHWRSPAYTARGISVAKALYTCCINHDTQVSTLGSFCVGTWAHLYWVSRPSDWMLSHLLLFAEDDPERSLEWTAILDATLQAIAVQLELNTTGLMADFVEYDAAAERYAPVTKQVLERDSDGCFGFNSCRTPWRLAVYFRETKDPRVLPILTAMTAFFEEQAAVVAGYKLDGSALAADGHNCFAAPVWCMMKVMGSSHAARVQRQIEAVQDGVYFGDSVQLLCIMQIAAQEHAA